MSKKKEGEQPETNETEKAPNAPAEEPEVIIATVEVGKEPEAEPVTKLSGVELDENLIKKRGFLLTLSTDPTPDELLKKELTLISDRYTEILKELKEQQSEREAQLNAEIDILEQQDVSLRDKKDEYLQYLESLNTEEAELKEKLKALHEQVAGVLRELGKAKQDVVGESLKQIQAELEQIMEINGDLQSTQNAELEKRYGRDKATFDQKISFWKDILSRHQEHYAEVADRMKLMARDGVNAQTAQFLVYLGGVAALVAGWWFSLWTGPAPSQDSGANVTGNTGVRFFFLDNIGKFLGGYPPGIMALIVVAYVVGVGFFSWLCHKLLVRNGFIVDIRELQKKHNKRAAEEQDDYEFDLEEQEKLLKAKVRSNAWWGLWLKLTPVILALVPLLGVISAEISHELQQKGDPNTFQGLFDSLVNEFIGTSIAVMLAVFAIVFLTRVSENRYHKNHNEESEKDRPGFNIRYIGFIFFGLMVLAMLLYHYPIPLFDDIRRVAIFGFVVSCLATSFSLGYGYIFNGLKNNADLLLFQIDTITSIIHYLSRPFQVNYTTNWSLKMRIYGLQQKMFDLVEGRTLLATDVAFGKEVSNVRKPVITVQTETGQTRSKSTEPEENLKKKKNKKNDQAEEQAKPGFFRRVYSWFQPTKFKPQSSSDEYLDELTVSHTDLIYFPETATGLKELHHQMQEVRERLAQISEAREHRWRNLGTWHSIGDQIIYNRKKIDQQQQVLADNRQRALTESVLISRMEEKEATLLKEGYYTGLWFRNMDPGKTFDIETAPLNLN